MRVAIVVGAATEPGRLSSAAARFASEAATDWPELEVETIDLAKTSVDVCDGRPLESCSEATQETVSRIAAADAVVIFSPTYRASFPGVLKNLLDLLPVEALRSKPVGVVAIGATDHHYLGVDAHLRAVLAWFGAIVAPVSVYLTSRDFDSEKQLAEQRAGELRELAVTVARRAESLSEARLGPAPLAARSVG